MYEDVPLLATLYSEVRLNWKKKKYAHVITKGSNTSAYQHIDVLWYLV